MYLWGVDSAEAVTEDLYQCVVEQFGHPGFWGRYLLRVPRISEGLTHEELALLRGQGLDLAIQPPDAPVSRGYRSGQPEAGAAAVVVPC